MIKNSKEINGITFDTTKPTQLSFEKLFTWVIWQFPRPIEDGFCGAVHPPQTEYGWFPAVIQLTLKTVSVYAHTTEAFSTPEAAADYFNNNQPESE